jgi:hypothetical protein
MAAGERTMGAEKEAVEGLGAEWGEVRAFGAQVFA